MSTRIHYITMSFPNRVEVFAANDIRALLAEGAELCVHSMRRRDPEAGNLLSQFALTDVGLTHNTWRSSLAGLRLLLTDHGYRSAAGKLLRLPGYGARELAKTLTILPRAVAITETIRRERPDIVHLFWGHYPSLVGALVQSSLPEVPLSMFLGAYDLEREYPPSKLVASQAAVVWTHAAANVPALLQLGVAAEKVRVAYRGLDHSRMSERGPKVPGRIVSAGRLIPAKRMDAVIEAFERILWRAQPASDAGDPRRRTGTRAARTEVSAPGWGIGERVRFFGATSLTQRSWRPWRRPKCFCSCPTRHRNGYPRRRGQGGHGLPGCACVAFRHHGDGGARIPSTTHGLLGGTRQRR